MSYPPFLKRPSARLVVTATGWLLLAQVTSELLFLYGNWQDAKVLAMGCTVVLPLLAWRVLGVREFYLLSLCLVLLGLNWGFGEGFPEIILVGLSRAAYLASFILLMALLREGAIGSNSVKQVGGFLTRQPPGRRFIAIFSGAHFFAVLINLGALSLLAPIIQRGVREGLGDNEPLDEIARVRERRQLAAALRGFSWFLVWAPTAVTQAVLPTLMTGIDPGRLMATGAVLAVLMFMMSWGEDRLRWRSLRRRLIAEGRLPVPQKERLPTEAAKRLVAVGGLLAGLTVLFSWWGDVTVVTGVMLASPLVVSAWVFAQQPKANKVQATKNRLDKIAFISMPGYAREAVFLASAAFIGTLAANLVPGAEVARAIEQAGLAPWMILWGLAVSVWLFGQVGLSPITMAVFLGSVVAQLPGLPIDMTDAALAIAAGTAVCTLGAPFASGVVMLSRASGIPPTTLTWRWNGPYALLCLAFLAVFFAIIA
ncbi:MAG: hypothetical protein AAF530_06870 [Pseudomonadota bacterium]